MSSAETSQKALAITIRQILQDARVPRADVHIEDVKSKTQTRQTYYAMEDNESGSKKDDDGTMIYAIGSLTKLLIVVLLSIIVDKLSVSVSPEHKHFRELRKFGASPWDVRFTRLFNHFNKIKMSPLPRNPTLRQVVLHLNSLPPMNHILLSPEGTRLMTEEKFLKIAPALAEAVYGTTGKSYAQYSNGNYVLIGLLIVAIAGGKETLESLMEQYLFKPLMMNHTSLSISGLANKPYAQPHAAFAEGMRKLIDPPPDPINDILTAALGAYSCTKDLAILLRALQQCINGDDRTFSSHTIEQLLRNEVLVGGPAEYAYNFCGAEISLKASMPGFKSINRLVCPDDVCSTYPLGLHDGTEDVIANYQAGSVNGYYCCYYFVPKQNIFLIVLTNASGRTDAADHISRLLLQKLFKLKRSPAHIKQLAAQLGDPKLNLRKSDLQPEVNIVEMCSRGAQKGQEMLERWGGDDGQQDNPNSSQLNLEGTYKNGLTEQLIRIRPVNGRFVVNISGGANIPRDIGLISGGANISRDIGLIRTGDLTFRLRPMNKDGFTIDRYDPFGWKELNFSMETETTGDGARIVVRLIRRWELLTDIYSRI